MAPTYSMSQAMSHASPTSILLNIGHAMDHWILVVFAYSWGVIAGVWGVEWTELTPFNYGALFMFGAGSIVSGRLGDLWGRWIMMVIFFAGMGVSALGTAVTGSIVFNFTTNGNGELLRERVKGAVQDPVELAAMLFVIFSLASLAQLVVGKLIDRFPLKTIYVPIVLLQVPLFLIASQVQDWALFVTAIGFMLLVFGAIPFTDAMIVKYIDDRMRSRVTGARLAIGFGVSSFVVALIGPTVKAAGFPTFLMALAVVAL